MYADHRRGKHSFLLPNQPVITNWASVAGKKEAQGPLQRYFDLTSQDTYFGQKTWEQAEQEMQRLALERLLEKSGMTHDRLGAVCSGDLLNQCIVSSFSLDNLGVPHIGLYGACSTMAESLMISAMAVDGGYRDHVVAMSSSHFAGSERQYRFPLGYGGQRTPSAQWTVTGAGAAMVSSCGHGPRIFGCTVGTVTELGVKDANNMGAAMAPAAYHTIRTHFEDFSLCAEDYDLIVTGDLGQLGKELLLELAREDGLPLGGRLADCGTLVFDIDRQDVHAGGSGCGCSAITLCGYLLEKLRCGKLGRILFCGTGALLSPTSSQQGLPIPGICHAVSIMGGA